MAHPVMSLTLNVQTNGETWYLAGPFSEDSTARIACRKATKVIFRSWRILSQQGWFQWRRERSSRGIPVIVLSTERNSVAGLWRCTPVHYVGAAPRRGRGTGITFVITRDSTLRNATGRHGEEFDSLRLHFHSPTHANGVQLGRRFATRMRRRPSRAVWSGRIEPASYALLVRCSISRETSDDVLRWYGQWSFHIPAPPVRNAWSSLGCAS